MDKREHPVIILSSGRAGSTLLQKLLNTNAELTIWGEHAGILDPLADAWRAIAESEWVPERQATGTWMLDSDRPTNVDRWTAWDGSFSKHDFRHSTKAYIKELFCRNLTAQQRWGFKEIRYRKIQLVEFLIALFPHARFILLMRNPVDSCVSFSAAFSRKRETAPDNYGTLVNQIAMNQIKPFVPFLKSSLERYPDQTFNICYEKLVADPNGVLDQLHKFLQLDSGFDPSRVGAMMAKKLVSEQARTSDDQLQIFRELAMAELADESAWYDSLSR